MSPFTREGREDGEFKSLKFAQMTKLALFFFLFFFFKITETLSFKRSFLAALGLPRAGAFLAGAGALLWLGEEGCYAFPVVGCQLSLAVVAGSVSCPAVACGI